jgi:hypothetical protein
LIVETGKTISLLLINAHWRGSIALSASNAGESASQATGQALNRQRSRY